MRTLYIEGCKSCVGSVLLPAAVAADAIGTVNGHGADAAATAAVSAAVSEGKH